MTHPVAVVTGANRSLGLQVAKNLYAKGFTVVLAVRDTSKGQEAADEIAKAYKGPALGNKLSVIRLDLADASSIPLAVEEFKKIHSRLDVFINNAAIISFDRKESLKVNYHNTIAVTEAFLPLLAAPKADKKIKSRLIIVSSRMGCFDGAGIKGDALAALLEHKDQAKIDALAKAWENGDDTTGLDTVDKYAPYSNSKALISTYGRILAQRVEAEKLPVNVFVTCPGYCSTDLNHHTGHKSIQEGADTLTWAAIIDSIEDSNGKFFAERREIPYESYDRAEIALKTDQVAFPPL